MVFPLLENTNRAQKKVLEAKRVLLAKAEAEAKAKVEANAKSRAYSTIYKLVTLLAEELSRLRKEILAGRAPKIDALDAARLQLLTALASFDDAARLPLLQRFLRTSAIELVAALRSTIGTSALQTMAERYASSFTAAEAQAQALLGKLDDGDNGVTSGTSPASTPDVGGKRPWEASI